jgi:hypothetical protein
MLKDADVSVRRCILGRWMGVNRKMWRIYGNG